MRKLTILSLFVLLVSFIKAETNNEFYFRTMVNLADYIANDYPNAVADGEVINEFEYAEMQEFTAKLQATYSETSKDYASEAFPSLGQVIQELNNAIIAKDKPIKVKSIASNLSSSLLEEGILENIPSQYPSISNGRSLYQVHCQQCHGLSGLGDGILGADLVPAPSNFRESAHLFPFHIYNTIQLGIEGTAMKPVSQLSEIETWDLAFYVMTLTYPDSLINPDLANYSQKDIDLKLLANQTNADMAKSLSMPEDVVKYLRFFKPVSSKDESLNLTLSMLRDARLKYQDGDYAAAEQFALDAYFIGFEPIEIALGAINPAKVVLVEKEMMTFRSLLKTEGNTSALKEQYNKIDYHFESIRKDESQNGFWFVFFASISILLREGLEALFIIVAILAALNSFEGGRKAVKYVHAGWITAFVVGVISYFFVGKLIALGSHKRELIEGFGALLAVVILFSVGFWLHDKSTVASWTKYVKAKLSKHLNANSLFSIAFLAFLVVFREAFESVLFLSTLTIDGSTESSFGVILGSALSALLLIVISILIVKYSKRLPIHKVFKISSITMLVLAVVLVGKGMKELQEAALIQVHLTSLNFSVDFLGIYPTYQTLFAQFFTLTLALILWNYQKKKKLS